MDIVLSVCLDQLRHRQDIGLVAIRLSLLRVKRVHVGGGVQQLSEHVVLEARYAPRIACLVVVFESLRQDGVPGALVHRYLSTGLLFGGPESG